MVQTHWMQAGKKNLVCVDSYENGILQGRFYDPHGEAEPFSSLSQFLVKMEELLNEQQMPQSYTEPRRFSNVFQREEAHSLSDGCRKGKKATFELQILFRQHTSWQGVLCWKDQGMEHSFRSVLELVLLMDSALRSPEGIGAA